MNPAPVVAEPSESEKPTLGSNVPPNDATSRPHGPLTKPFASPDALPSESAALSVPRAAVLVPLIRKMPYTCPTPFDVSTRLQARIVRSPARRGSALDAVPVYVARVASNVSPPVTEHVTWYCCDTVVASNVADVLCTAGAPRCAVAIPAAASAVQAAATRIHSRFFPIGCPPRTRLLPRQEERLQLRLSAMAP